MRSRRPRVQNAMRANMAVAGGWRWLFIVGIRIYGIREFAECYWPPSPRLRRLNGDGFGWGGVAEDGLDELVGFLGGVVFAVGAFFDGLGDGLVDLEGLVGAGFAAGEWALVFEVFFDHGGVYWSVGDFNIYLCGGSEVALFELGAEVVALGLGYHGGLFF